MVELINVTLDQTKGDVLTFTEGKFEKRPSEEAAKFEHYLTEEVTCLDVKISEVKADLICWMFLF